MIHVLASYEEKDHENSPQDSRAETGPASAPAENYQSAKTGETKVPRDEIFASHD